MTEQVRGIRSLPAKALGISENTSENITPTVAMAEEFLRRKKNR